MRIEAAQRILLEDILRHPWMRLDTSNSKTFGGCNTPTLTSTDSTNSINNPVSSTTENQHKPSLNSVGSCISSSTDESSSQKSPSCGKRPPVRGCVISEKQPRLRPARSAPQTTGPTPAAWVMVPFPVNNLIVCEAPSSEKIWHEAKSTMEIAYLKSRERHKAGVGGQFSDLSAADAQVVLHETDSGRHSRL